ncbi:MHS family MFS transporter [Pseudonocardia sp. RS11V-5]|uniref:MFS transporter n=1 Tax=Pseudonocardia terrae TaxID=2905831 RepID=UPI001E404F06|nr:MFS transporter [Pseudonocardia terrae]MCE3550862.1 MHS family MFS transporter [Pseudonocardia terrae]
MIYATLAASVFNTLFFPALDPVAGTIASLSTFAAGFISRPLGGIVFGHFGDRLGRKTLLVWSLVLMGVSTALIGLLPTYATIGVAAPILLTVLRILQGFALGGEWSGATTMIVEHAPEGRRAFFASFVPFSSGIGFLAALGTTLGLRAGLSPEAFLAWGWRVPFIASVILVAIGLYLRLRVEETRTFREVAEAGTVQLPLVRLLRTQWRTVLLTFCMHLGTTTVAFVVATFMLSYATLRPGLDNTVMMAALATATAINLCYAWTIGILADRIGRRCVFAAGCVVLMVIAFPMFWLVDTAVFVGIVAGLLLGLAAQYLCNQVEASYLSELFPPEVRCTGVNLGYQLCNTIAGGTAPLVAVLLMEWSGGEPWSISVYLIVLGAISLVAGLLAKETSPRTAAMVVDADPARAAAQA